MGGGGEGGGVRKIQKVLFAKSQRAVLFSESQEAGLLLEDLRAVLNQEYQRVGLF